MNIKILIEELAKRNPSCPWIKFLADYPLAELCIEEQSGGMVNHVYKVVSPDNKHSIVIKYGESQSKEFMYNLSLARQDAEYSALELLHKLHPGAVPQPYCFDKYLQAMVMEDVSHMSLLEKVILKEEAPAGHAAMLGHIMATLHQHTHRRNLSDSQYEAIKLKYRGDNLDALIKYKYMDILGEHPNPGRPAQHNCLELYTKCMKRMKGRELANTIADLARREDCLVHNDLHRSSIFVSSERVAIFDFEFVCLANPALDVHHALLNYVISQNQLIYANLHRPDRHEHITEEARQHMNTVLKSYFHGRTDHPTLAEDDQFRSEVVLLLGAAFFLASMAPGEYYDELADCQVNKLMSTGVELMMVPESYTTWQHLIETALLPARATLH